MDRSLDFLKTDPSGLSSPTAQFIGHHMTKEDPYYTPAPANTNPFATHAQLSAGKKLIASEIEAEARYESFMTLPIYSPLRVDTKQMYSLPSNPGLVQRAIANFNSQISSSQLNRMSDGFSPVQKLFDEFEVLSPDSAVDMLSPKEASRLTRQNSKQKNLECAMLFCGLDLIQLNRASSSDWSDTQISTDLESEFQDDLEDVLRADCWLEDILSTPDSGIIDTGSEWWQNTDQADPTTSRYLHPTLVEKRKQLKRVESNKEKLEQLQIKLDQLRKTTLRKTSESRKKTKA